MQTTSITKKIFLCLCFNIFFILFFTSISYAETEKTPETEENINTIATEQVTDVVLSLIESQKRELDTIEDESELISSGLKQELIKLKNKTKEVSITYHSLSSIYETGSLSANARSILTKQINSLYDDLNNYYSPLLQTNKIVSNRISQLTSIINNFKIMDKNLVAHLDIRAKELLTTYQNFQKRINKYLPNAELILNEIKALSESLAEKLPALWLNYYLTATENILSPLVWQNELKNFKDIFSTISRTLRNELPNTLGSWILFAIRILLVIIFVGIPLYTSTKFTKKLPMTYHKAWKAILKSAMPYIILGIGLFYASWQASTVYQIGMGLSALCMCYGQIQFSFILHNMDIQDPPAKSTILFFVPILFISLILLTFTPLILTLSFLWTLILIYLIYYIIKLPRNTYIVAQYITNGFCLLTTIGVLITPSGLARLSILMTLLYICLSVGLYQAFSFVHLSKVVQNTLQNNSSGTFFFELVHAFLFPVLLLLSILTPFTWILAYPGGSYLIQNFSSFDFNFGTFSINTLQIFSILFAFYLTKSIIKVINNFIDSKWNNPHNNSISNLTTPIKTTVLFGCWGLFALYGLKVLGFSLTSLTVVAGGLSVGIGLGLQGFVQNIFSGFSLIFGQNIREGDVVDVGGVSGIVQKVSLRATQVRTYDNAIIFVPNSQFLNTTFTNWTHNGTMVRRAIQVGVAYETDTDLVIDTTMKVLKEQKDILAYPEPTIIFMNFGASSLDFEIRFWIKDLETTMSVLTNLRLALNQAYKEKGIEIPFPQTDIHVFHNNSNNEKQEKVINPFEEPKKENN